MARTIIVAGDSGTGKSRAIKNLNPDTTAVIQVLEGKDLPFRKSSSLYSIEKGNMLVSDKGSEILTFAKQKVEEGFNTIILDDAGFIMQNMFFAFANQTGYDKFNKIGLAMQKIIKGLNSLPKHVKVYMTFHIDRQVTDNTTTLDLKTIGRLLSDKYNPMATVTTVLVSGVQYDKKQPIYGFYTNRTVVNGVEMPAKSPEEMFDKLFIENDYAAINAVIDEYYN